MDHREFGLRELVRGPRSHGRAVLGAHVVEAANPSRWVPPQWIVLTTGLRLWRDPAAQRELVAELAEGGVVALGFGTGIVFDQVPKALLEEAERRAFPVFEVPERIPFREIVRMVDTALLGQDLRTFRRTAAITDGLVQALGEPDPETALVAALAGALRAEVSLHTEVGAVLFTTGSYTTGSGAEARWRRLRELPLNAPPVEVIDADGLFATAVEVDGDITGWVLVEVSRGSLAVPVILRALTVVGKLLEGLGTVRGRELARRRTARAELLHRALALRPELPAGVVAELRDHGRALGVDPDVPGRVLALRLAGVAPEPEAPRTSDPDSPYPDSRLAGRESAARRTQNPDSPYPDPRLAERGSPTRRGREADSPVEVAGVERVLAEWRVSYLVAGDSGRVVVWVVEGAGWTGEELGEALLGVADVVAVGVGARVTGLARAREGLADAELALASATTARPVVSADRLGVAEWLVLAVGPERVKERAATVLAPLREQGFLVDTLREYLRCALSVPATARALHVHENSVRHRLARVRALLGRELHAPDTLADLHLALLLEVSR
ncbi:hypothetical protein GCM10023321_05600 [Pseudonocardia eucalypti]|uniref:PucR family transcriptional regulator n=1 Tax=Pseudonocardia eucalypti TaxID=648755 RepID=A0ABP9PN06_9PSEU